MCAQKRSATRSPASPRGWIQILTSGGLIETSLQLSVEIRAPTPIPEEGADRATVERSPPLRRRAIRDRIDCEADVQIVRRRTGDADDHPDEEADRRALR